MRSVITRTALGCLALGLALSLTSCDFPGSGSKDAKKPAATAAPSDDNWDQAVGAEIDMISGLKEIDPDLIDDQQKAIDAAAEVCKEIKKSKGDGAGLGQVAAAKFAEVKAGLTAEDGDKIVTLLKDTTCK
ncbi:hypothetical protein [Kitasatospora cheerisanensis]|uniref:DUF732 domain-containing protein n=1 Tax=Kitasatospora cheerisanensis KCTC 2395 TaxID=1348663 RepID=A0A066YYU3_9ACTN|nr:hypothetical protein [Kitasatospora cheerisanensis]KDN86673.1 hypothetical protein KCH_15510 [Kitasatospora cheerisanensis KCTC 2395]